MERLSNLETIRKTKGLTRQELADLSKVNPTTIQRLEKGMYDVNMVKLGTLIALSKALHCKVINLVDKDLKRYIGQQ